MVEHQETMEISTGVGVDTHKVVPPRWKTKEGNGERGPAIVDG